MERNHWNGTVKGKLEGKSFVNKSKYALIACFSTGKWFIYDCFTCFQSITKSVQSFSCNI